MNFKNHISQVYLILTISIITSLAVNILRPNSIPFLAKELEQVENIDFDSDEPLLLTISLDQAKSFMIEIPCSLMHEMRFTLIKVTLGEQ